MFICVLCAAPNITHKIFQILRGLVARTHPSGCAIKEIKNRPKTVGFEFLAHPEGFEPSVF